MPIRSRKTKARIGDHKLVCDVGGETIFASESRLRWDGKVVCEKHWEPRHPQDFYRVSPEDTSVSPVRSPPETDSFSVDTSTWIDTTAGDPNTSGHNDGSL